MSREEKQKVVGGLGEKFSRSTLIVTTDYRGLNAANMLEIRRWLRERGMEFRVVKNTLAHLAAQKVGKQDLMPLVDGPTALALSYGDVVQAAKAIVECIRVTKIPLVLKGGITDGRVLNAGELSALAFLPPREVVLGQVLRAMASPLSQLVAVLNAPLYGFMAVLQARMQQLGDK
ncbi:MAG: 50S ribosomal protein L10 [Chloroflexi bacterium]|nr:50S ribosomal protein L10 [Chloroflexota bacterium]